MKMKAVFLGFFLLHVLYINCEFSRHYITCKEVEDCMSQASGKALPEWYLINVLPRYVCTDCMIPGSSNIPIHLLEKKLKNDQKWPRSRKIIVYCAGGNCQLGQYAYDILKHLGFGDIHILKGGIAAWKSQGYPVSGKCTLGYE